MEPCHNVFAEEKHKSVEGWGLESIYCPPRAIGYLCTWEGISLHSGPLLGMPGSIKLFTGDSMALRLCRTVQQQILKHESKWLLKVLEALGNPSSYGCEKHGC